MPQIVSVRNFATATKGQLISKWFFGVVDFLKKTNENKSTWGIIVVKSNSSVRFLEEIDDLKNHLEIIWPLEGRPGGGHGWLWNMQRDQSLCQEKLVDINDQLPVSSHFLSQVAIWKRNHNK